MSPETNVNSEGLRYAIIGAAAGIATTHLAALAQIPPRFYWKSLAGANAVPVIFQSLHGNANPIDPAYVVSPNASVDADIAIVGYAKMLPLFDRTLTLAILEPMGRISGKTSVAGVDFDRAREAFDGGLDRIKPHAASGHLGQLGGGGEPGREHELGRFTVILAHRNAQRDRAVANRGQVQAATVVFDIDHDLTGGGSGGQGDASYRGLALGASRDPAHALLANVWKPSDAGFADIVRAALVLCADHELNVSAFAARVVASTGAHLHATVCAGLAALSGPRHGGATARAYALITDARDAASPRDFIETRLQRGDDLPGFGHALYPHGDPRAAELLARLRAQHANAPAMRELDAIVTATEDVSGQHPNIDFMLAAICHANALPATPALVMFAAGRLAGWLAHALEQQAEGKLIRPRARYTGVMPGE